MADWPSGFPAPSYGSSGATVKPQIRTPFEGNYTQTRSSVSRAVDTNSLVWNHLSEADFGTLRTFFNTNQGNAITNFPEPGSGNMKTIRFAGNSLDWAWDDYGGRTVKVEIEEI